MNPCQKLAILLLRFVALMGLVTSVVQAVFWIATIYSLTQGITDTNAFGLFAGSLRGPLMVAGFLLVGGVILMILSRPIGRAMGRDLGD